MRFLLICCLSAISSTAVYAAGCSVGGLSAPEMRLSNYVYSETATSFHISCDRSYSITFRSQNLKNNNGLSSVSNGPYQLRTQLKVIGGSDNLWGAIMNQRAGQDRKYTISARLMDNPLSYNVPAGVYRDKIYVNVDF
ncbi:hypothetical protein B9T33_12570 [Acinetobacter sp. ANC 5054]|uniref:hypothetical protein n=1 Tax=Acinetobacter sp. ANC 5054 TaxID=1977877 RepID=UPI000A34225E|nr:hypothetical protein [Acinetobacter sp. ANC 5054]OTG79308.1 hypothetical protein B9T33_12570 [Acinetobacter sp. ANC 5054]